MGQGHPVTLGLDTACCVTPVKLPMPWGSFLTWNHGAPVCPGRPCISHRSRPSAPVLGPISSAEWG